MKDKIIKITAANGSIVGTFAYTKEVVETSRTIHKTSPVVTAALGEDF